MKKKKRRKNTKRGKAQKRRVSPALIGLLIALALAIAVVAGMGAYAAKFRNYDKIMPNVYVGGVDVGGMTWEEAVDTLETSFGTGPRVLMVLLPDKTLSVEASRDDTGIDVDAAVEAAFACGRERNGPLDLAAAYRRYRKHRTDVELGDALGLDSAYIDEQLQGAAKDAEQPLEESLVETDKEARIITVTIGQPGQILDAEALRTAVEEAFAAGNCGSIPFTYTTTYPAVVLLDRLYEQLSVEPQEAEFDKETGEETREAVKGYAPQISLEEANEVLATAGYGEVLTFPFVEVLPETLEEEDPETSAKPIPGGEPFQDVLASYGSVYDASNTGRTKNLELACAAINGTVLQPGETFSFNGTVGERTADKGYRNATVYVSGQSVEQLGGGVCQVASTIYTCCMYADLKIVHREPHMYFVTYVPGGLDATVYWGSVDFKFRNSTDYPLRIDACLSGGKCCVSLMGTDVDHHTVKIESICVATRPFETIERAEDGENISGYTGYTYEIVRYVYDANGNLIRTDSTAALDAMGNLGTSTYSKRNKVIYTGAPAPTPTPTPTPTEEPSPEPTPTPTPTPTPDPTPTPTDPAPEPPPETPTDPAPEPPPAEEGT